MPDAPEPNATPAPFASAPRWRREPYRLFFALGLLHAWAGVSPWLLLSLDLIAEDRRVYHSIAQIQGFMICFAVGFLFTMVPRRTRTQAPTTLDMVVGLVCPVGTTICAAFELFMPSQLFWLLLVGILGRFLRRAVVARTAPPAALRGLIYVPIALALGLIGSTFFAAFGAFTGMGTTGAWVPDLHEYGQLFLLQGMFLTLSLGVSGMVFKTLIGATAGVDIGHRWMPWLVTALLITTFVIEVEGGRRLAFALRAGAVLLVLVWQVGILRPPALPGPNRWLLWSTSWMLPLGYAIAALHSDFPAAGLHVTFIGGFASMVFAVGMHVAISHDGRKESLARWSWPIISYGALFLFATVTRVAMEFDLENRNTWMGWSSGAFLLGTMCWATLAVPALVPKKRQA